MLYHRITREPVRVVEYLAGGYVAVVPIMSADISRPVAVRYQDLVVGYHAKA